MFDKMKWKENKEIKNHKTDTESKAIPQYIKVACCLVQFLVIFLLFFLGGKLDFENFIRITLTLILVHVSTISLNIVFIE